MARALAVSGGLESPGRDCVASSSPAVLEKIATEPSRTSAGISTHPKLNLSEARAVLRAHAKEVIFGAFWHQSQHETCIRAANACGVSPDKIDRLIGGEVASPDALVLGFCAGIYAIKTGRDSPIRSVLAQIIAAEVQP